MDETDLTKLQFDVYMTRDGPWNPEHGEIEIPDDWEFLPSGDSFVIRRVKAAERFWVAWRPLAGTGRIVAAPGMRAPWRRWPARSGPAAPRRPIDSPNHIAWRSSSAGTRPAVVRSFNPSGPRRLPHPDV